MLPYNYTHNTNTKIAAIALPSSTMHPQLWVELLTFKPHDNDNDNTINMRSDIFLEFLDHTLMQ